MAIEDSTQKVKICSHCNTSLFASDFNINLNNPGGLDDICIECQEELDLDKKEDEHDIMPLLKNSIRSKAKATDLNKPASVKVKKCSKCGKEKPATLDEFDSGYKGGLLAFCKQCRRDYQAELRKKKKKDVRKPVNTETRKPGNLEKPTKTIPVVTKKELPSISCIISVDFTNYPELFEKIHGRSIENFRPINYQILSILNHFFTMVK